MENIIRENFIRFLVQRAIFCPISGVVLDYRTCGVINDPDGDPAYVVAPAVARQVQDLLDEGVEAVLSEGFSLDPSRVPSA